MVVAHFMLIRAYSMIIYTNYLHWKLRRINHRNEIWAILCKVIFYITIYFSSNFIFISYCMYLISLWVAKYLLNVRFIVHNWQWSNFVTCWKKINQLNRKYNKWLTWIYWLNQFPTFIFMLFVILIIKPLRSD